MAETRTVVPDRVVPMRVIVCGVHRTGTLSMRTALWQLGFHDCYHMSTVMNNLDTDPEQWQRAIEAKYAGKGTFDKKDFDKVLGHSQACVDLPAAFFGAELADMYPDAKVVILNRDPDKWYESALHTVHHVASGVSLGGRLVQGFCYLFDPAMRKWARFMGALTAVGLPFDHGREKAKAIAWFNGQYDEYRSRIPEARRLEFRVQDGWAPLCAHLGVPVPTVRDGKTGKMVTAPFPRVNDRESFLEALAGRRAMFVATATENMFSMLGKLALALAIGYAGHLVWTTRLMC